jgi:hypothetical protein
MMNLLKSIGMQSWINIEQKYVMVTYSMGEVLATFSTLKGYIIDPDIAGAMAVFRAAQFCRELGFYRVVLEGDVRYGHIIEDVL